MSSAVTADSSTDSGVVIVPLNPIPPLLVRWLTMRSSPTNAPPAMNKILVVSISTVSPAGCLRPRVTGTRQLVPSTSLSRACCTPSPDTSRVILALSLRRAILSISSM